MPQARSFVHVSEEWVVDETLTVGPFVTRESYRLPDGSHLTWSSRRHRKVGRAGERSERSSSWWQPRELGWWIAALFMVGSFLFGLGALPLYAAQADVRIVSVTYFVGSIFFTSAGYLQYVQTINAPREIGPVEPETQDRFRLVTWQLERIDWWSASVQSVGTLLFNISTFSAMDSAFSLHQRNGWCGRPTCSVR